MLFQNRQNINLKPSKVARNALLLVASSVMTLTAFASPAMAQSCAEGGISDGADKQFSPEVGALTQGVLDLANKGQYKAQLAALEQILYAPDLKPYESGVIYQMLGSAHYELLDFGASVNAFEKALLSGGLTAQECRQLELNIAQLYMVNDQNREGALRLERYVETQETIKPQHVELLVTAWVAAEEYERALPWAERSFKKASPKQQKHFDLLHFLYGELGAGHKQIEIREQKAALFPSSPARIDY